MKKEINYYELKRELAELGFNEPQVIDDLRGAVYLANDEQRIATSVNNVAFDLELMRDGHGRLSLIAYSASLGAGTDNWQLQTFQPNVHAFAAAELLAARATYKPGDHDLSFLPLDPKTVAQEIKNLNNRLFNIDLTTAESFAGFLEESRQNGQRWITYELRDEQVLDDSWFGFSNRQAAVEDAEIIRPFARLADLHELLPELYRVIDRPIQLKTLSEQLSGLGFRDTGLAYELEGMLKDDRARDIYFDQDTIHYALSYEKKDNTFVLYGIDASIDVPGVNNLQTMQYFQPDVDSGLAKNFLEKRLGMSDDHDPMMPINKQEAKDHLQRLSTIKINDEQLNPEKMNTQKLDQLKKNLLNLGFGEQVNAALEKNIGKKVPEFTLPAKHDFNQSNVDYTLHFKAGDEQYFFNKFDAVLNKGKESEESQTFYINRGNGVTAKEAFNLMEGRAVYKQLYNKEGEGYHAWLQLDNEKLTENGNKEIKRFTEKYGFDLEKVLAGKDIKELKSQDTADNLYRSLKKGNTQQVTVERNGEEKKYFIAASPQFKTVDLYDHQMKKIKREELLKPEQRTSNKQKQGAQQKEAAPAKKSSKRKGVSV